MTSGASAINSAAYLGTLPWSAAKRYSIRTLCPSRHPSSCSSCRNAATRCCTSGSSAGRFTSTPMRRIRSACCARAASGHAAAAPPSSVMNSRRFVCRESSILRGDGGSVMTVSPSRPEARSRFGTETANELGAPVASSIPEQLPGREPASTRKGYEDGNALFRWYRRVEGSFGHHGVA